jgi:hypothetical protein
MSFLYDAYYLVEPRLELAPQLYGKTDAEFAELLLEPSLIRNVEGGRTIWKNDNHAATVKLLFLARLREYDPLSADSDAERLLGSSRINVATFDRWWTLRRFVVDESCEDLIAFLRAARAKVDACGDELVAAWLASVLKPNNDDSAP